MPESWVPRHPNLAGTFSLHDWVTPPFVTVTLKAWCRAWSLTTIVLLDSVAIGLIQTYRLRDYPEYAACIGLDEGAGTDLFIGEFDHVGRGIGPLVISAFARDVVFGLQGMEVCVASPDPRNRRSLRAFEKAGFERRKMFTVPGTGTRETLVVLRRR
jgi:RimJ/RimL family protein N-acetyltransferase